MTRPRKYGVRVTEIPTWRSWSSMRRRCLRPGSDQYPNYGGRGIRICERWDSYSNFLADMGERPPGTSLDRIDVNGHYEPGNCRWATQVQQNNNKRTTLMLTVGNRTLSISDWARISGQTRNQLWKRIADGVPPERAVDPRSLREGPDNCRAVFSAQQVVKMRELRAAGASTLELADAYGVGFGVIANICAGRTYAAAGGPITKGRTVFGRTARRNRVEI